MFGDITDLITSHSDQVNKLKAIKDTLKRFDSIKGKSQLHYTKLFNDLKEIVDITEE